jgi:uncharacterized membrane protein
MGSRVQEPISDHHVGQRHLDRMVMLSDGVFAIAITLSAIEIKPETAPGQSLWQAWSIPLLVYFFSFFIIGTVWMFHRRMVAHLRDIDGVGSAINLVLLCVVALMPVVNRFVFTDAVHASSITVFAAMMVVTFVLLAVFWGYLAFVAKLAPDLPRSTARLWLIEMMSPMIGALSVILYESGYWIALSLVLVVYTVLLLVRARAKRRADASGS